MLNYNLLFMNKLFITNLRNKYNFSERDSFMQER